jgi:hypothetical protein
MNGKVRINVGGEYTLVWGLNSKSEQFVANLEAMQDGAKAVLLTGSTAQDENHDTKNTIQHFSCPSYASLRCPVLYTTLTVSDHLLQIRDAHRWENNFCSLFKKVHLKTSNK